MTVPNRMTPISLSHRWTQKLSHNLTSSDKEMVVYNIHLSLTNRMVFKLERRNIKKKQTKKICVLQYRLHGYLYSLRRLEPGNFLPLSASIKVISRRSKEQRKTFIYKRKFNGTVCRNFYLCCTWHHF